jgi:type VI secretion system protein VasG
MRKIVGLKLRKVVSRLEANGRINLTFAPAVTDWIAERCTVEETGARNVDAIIQSLVLPRISTEILTRMAEEKPIKTITVDVEGAGGIRASFD